MSLPVIERVRIHRARQHRARALITAALYKQLPVEVLASELEALSAGDLEERKWSAAGAAALHAPCNVRRDFDAYFTQPPVARACTRRVVELLERWGLQQPPRALEPSAGLGAFVRAVEELLPETAITAVDILVRPELRELTRDRDGHLVATWPVCVVQRDFLAWSGFAGPYELIVGNPPFDQAEVHVRHALSLLRPGGVLAFILRAGFIASVERNDPAGGLWSRKGLREWSAITPRPSFIEGGTDQTEYSLYVWQQGYAGDALVGEAIRWKEPSSTLMDIFEEDSASSRAPPQPPDPAPPCAHPGCGHPMLEHADSPEGAHRGTCATCKYNWTRCSGYRWRAGAELERGAA